MTAAFVQYKSGVDFSASDLASKVVTLNANWTAGNALLVAVLWFKNSAQVASVTDSAGNTYTGQTEYSYGAGNSALRYFLCKNLAGTPGAAITVSFSPAAPYIGIECFEISGQDTTTQPDVAVAGQFAAFTTATDNITSGNITTVTNGCLVVETTGRAYTGGTVASGTGFTGTAVLTDGTNVVLKSGYQLQASAGLIAGTFTQSGATNCAPMVIAIRPATAAVSRPLFPSFPQILLQM